MEDDFNAAFEAAARSIFSSWTALVLAVEHQFGGPKSRQKVIDMFQELMSSVNRSKGMGKEPNWDAITCSIEDFMEYQLSCEVDDGSIDQVVQHLRHLYDECAQQEYGSLNATLARNAKARGWVVIWGSMLSAIHTFPMPLAPETDSSLLSSSSVTSDRMDTEVTEQIERVNNNIDNEDDGWVTVTKKGRRK